VEVDETFIGGEEPGLRGGRAPGQEGPDLHRCRDKRAEGSGPVQDGALADASAKSLHAFVTDHVEPDSSVITDVWQGYRGLDKLGYAHDLRSHLAARCRGEDPGELVPAVHRVASLIKRWLLGTGVDRRRPPAGVPQRVRVPIEPPPLAQPGHDLLPRARARGRSRPDPVPRPDRQRTAGQDATRAAGQAREAAAEQAREAAEPGPPPSEPPVADRRPVLLRFDGYPKAANALVTDRAPSSSDKFVPRS
jgi:hypothetical protein